MSEPGVSSFTLDQAEILDLLTALVQKSLAVYEEDEQGRGRYRLLETVRQYARDRLLEAGEGGAVRERHRDWFPSLAEELAEATGGGADRLEQEHDNLRAALAWSGAHGDGQTALRLGAALAGFWKDQCHWTEGREHLARLVARPGAEAPTAARTRALLGAGHLTRIQTDFGAARALFEESLAICRGLGDAQGAAESLRSLGHTLLHQGDYEAARAPLEESLAIFRALGDRQGVVGVLGNLAWLAHGQGDYGVARSLYEECLAFYRERGQEGSIAWALLGLGNVARDAEGCNAAQALFAESLAIFRERGSKEGIAATLMPLGETACEQGEYGAARAFFAESLAIFQKAGAKPSIARNLEGLAAVAVAQGQPERAARLSGAAERLREVISAPLSPADRVEHDRSVFAARAALGQAAFAAAWIAGQAMPLEEAVAFALQANDAI